MPKLVWSVLCHHGIVDKFTNNLTVVNQIDQLNVPPPPVPMVSSVRVKKSNGVKAVLLPISLCVVTVWEREKRAISEVAKGRCTLIGPTKQRLAVFEFDVNLRKTLRARFLGSLPGLPVSGEGTYRFLLQVRRGAGWLRVGEVTFDVNYRVASRIH